MALRPIFSSGVHRTPHPKKEWSEFDVAAVFAGTKKLSPVQMPLVLGHPENDLPVLGYLSREALLLKAEGGKALIMVDDEKDASFSAEAIDSARKSGHNKISVKIKMPEMYIQHIGLVTEAAVAELNSATFAEGVEPEAEYAVFEAETVFGDAGKHSLLDTVTLALKEFFQGKPGGVGPAAPNASFSTTTTDDAMTEAERMEMQALKDKVAVFEAAAATAGKAARTAAIDAVFSAEEHKGKVTEKNRPALQKMAESLYPADATFGADEDPLKPLKEVLASMPVIVPENGHAATFGTAAAGTTSKVDAVRKEISAVTGD